MSLDLSSVATELLADLASTDYVKLVRVVGATYDPVTASSTGGTESVINLTAAVLPMPDKLLNSSRIKATDEYILMDGQTKPLTSDKVRVSGRDYSIEWIEEANHAGTPQYYEVVARG